MRYKTPMSRKLDNVPCSQAAAQNCESFFKVHNEICDTNYNMPLPTYSKIFACESYSVHDLALILGFGLRKDGNETYQLGVFFLTGYFFDWVADEAGNKIDMKRK